MLKVVFCVAYFFVNVATFRGKCGRITGVPVIVNSLDNLPSNFDSLGARMDNAALLSEAGVPVILTSGGGPNARKSRQVAGVAIKINKFNFICRASIS